MSKDDDLRLITMKELTELLPYTPQYIRRMVKEGNFPRHIQLTENRIAWLRREVEAWIRDKVMKRDNG